MSIIDEARKLRPIIEQATKSLDDKTASTAATLLPGLKKDGKLVKAGTRINWGGVVKKAAVDLWDTAENSPDNAPALWADIEYKDGYRFIPETITVTTAFGYLECGWWKDELYRSLAVANVYTPDVNPFGWEKIGDRK